MSEDDAATSFVKALAPPLLRELHEQRAQEYRPASTRTNGRVSADAFVKVQVPPAPRELLEHPFIGDVLTSTQEDEDETTSSPWVAAESDDDSDTEACPTDIFSRAPGPPPLFHPGSEFDNVDKVVEDSEDQEDVFEDVYEDDHEDDYNFIKQEMMKNLQADPNNDYDRASVRAQIPPAPRGFMGDEPLSAASGFTHLDASVRTQVPPVSRGLTGDESLSSAYDFTSLGPSVRAQVPPVPRGLVDQEPPSIYDSVIHGEEVITDSSTARHAAPCGRNWSSPTILDTTFGSDVNALATFVSVLQHLDTEEHLSNFLNDPHDDYVNLREPNPTCFTDIFMSGISHYLSNNDIYCIAINFRKECRRNSSDSFCRENTLSELVTYALATLGELVVAQRLFGIRIAVTVAISSNACQGLDAMQNLESAAGTLGRVLKVPWHPRAIIEMTHTHSLDVARRLVKDMFMRDYGPAIHSIFQVFNRPLIENVEEGVWNMVCYRCVNSLQNFTLAFTPIPDVSAMSAILPSIQFQEVKNAEELGAMLDLNRQSDLILRHFPAFQRRRYRLALEIAQLFEGIGAGVGWAPPT
ncbi:Fc.00g078170.m01.CDS01 [Cosmosporella sp. VM-42]